MIYNPTQLFGPFLVLLLVDARKNSSKDAIIDSHEFLEIDF